METINKDSIQSIGVSATQTDQQLDGKLATYIQRLGINSQLVSDLLANDLSLEKVYQNIKQEASTTDINTITNALPQESAGYNQAKTLLNNSNNSINSATDENKQYGNMYNSVKFDRENYIQTLQNQQNRAKIYNKGFTLNGLK